MRARIGRFTGPTRRGRRALDRWLDRPVTHVRDLRIEFLLKLRLNERRERGSGALVAAQRDALNPTLDELTNARDGDVVDAWRRQNAVAARAFLERLTVEASPST